MSLREFFTDWSKGDRMTGFWCLYRLRNRAKRKMIRDILTFFFNRSARRHGGYGARRCDFGRTAAATRTPRSLYFPFRHHRRGMSDLSECHHRGGKASCPCCGKWVSHRSGCSAGGEYPYRRRSKDRRRSGSVSGYSGGMHRSGPAAPDFGRGSGICVRKQVGPGGKWI